MPNTSNRSWLETGWLVTGLLVAAFFFWNAFPHAGLSRAPSNDLPTSRMSGRHKTIPIEQIRVGDRVVTKLPKEVREADLPQSLANPQTVDPNTWRLVRLQAETTWDDGTIDDIHVETLQPPEWFAFHRAEVGASVPIPLDLIEMGLPETLMAKVLAIERCPSLQDGPGQTVLTTVNHLNNYVFDLTITDEHGQTETIGVTGFHKLYSATRRAWISAEELSVGEQLNGQGKTLRVAAVGRRAGTHRVYNMTVERQHVYRVSSAAVLVHNNRCARTTWPNTADEMDEFLGFPGTKIPDGPGTPGRDKTIWTPNEDTKITFEQHPYHADAPAFHQDYHWHLDTPTQTHQRYLPGENIPGLGFVSDIGDAAL